MGTPNFASPDNASKYFAVLTNEEVKYRKCKSCKDKHTEHEYNLEDLTECPNCSGKLKKVKSYTHVPESWECDDFISNMGYAIKEAGGTIDNEHDGDRSYPSQTLGYLSESKQYGDVEIEVRVMATLTSAYYEGATLDYNIEIYNGGDWADVGNTRYAEDVDDVIAEYFEDHSYMPVGMQKIQSKYAENWASNTISDLSEKMEAIFEQWTSHKLECTARFSNGEAIYQKVA